MGLSDKFRAFAAEQFAPLGQVEIKRMFGGASAYFDGQIFALLDNDAIYFKVDDTSKAKFEAEGMEPLTYPSKNGIMTMERYRRCPDRLFDEPDEFVDWARTAIAVAKSDPPKAKKSKAVGAQKPRPAPASKPSKR